MKKVVIGVILAKALLLGTCAISVFGCAGFTESAKPKFKNPEQEALYQYYCQIDPTNLTTGQKKELAEFDQSIGRLTDRELQFIRQFPWLNPDHLTTRDKLFLLKISERVVNAAMSVG